MAPEGKAPLSSPKRKGHYELLFKQNYDVSFNPPNGP
jgi:hypothetical protein